VAGTGEEASWRSGHGSCVACVDGKASPTHAADAAAMCPPEGGLSGLLLLIPLTLGVGKVGARCTLL
jgi:hypothetical protein